MLFPRLHLFFAALFGLPFTPASHKTVDPTPRVEARAERGHQAFVDVTPGNARSQMGPPYGKAKGHDKRFAKKGGRDRKENKGDHREDRMDRREDVADRREDVRDHRTDGGRRDQMEDRADRQEDRRDTSENHRDNREDRADVRHGPA